MAIVKQTLWITSRSSLKLRPDREDFFIDSGREPLSDRFIELVALVISLTLNEWTNLIWLIVQVNRQA